MPTIIINSMEGPLQLLLADLSAIGEKNTSMEKAQPSAIPGSTHLSAIIASLCWEPDGQGAETLIPNLAELLEKNNVSRSAIKRIACVRGPGSFTGIRLALSTALGLSRSLPGKPLLAGLDYLPLLAASAQTRHTLDKTGSLWALTHARRGQVHIQGFALKDLSPLCSPQGCLLEQACSLIVQAGQDRTPQPIYLAGSGLARNREFFAARFPQARLLDELLYPAPEALLTAAAGAVYASAPIEPLYLRASDAEENLPYIATGLGLDPHQAMLDLLKLTGRSN